MNRNSQDARQMNPYYPPPPPGIMQGVMQQQPQHQMPQGMMRGASGDGRPGVAPMQQSHQIPPQQRLQPPLQQQPLQQRPPQLQHQPYMNPAGNTQGPLPNLMMMPPSFNRSNISELVQVPNDLATFAGEPQFQQILLQVKEQTKINFISLNRTSDNMVESVAIDAPTREAAQLARNLIETHFKLQIKLRAAETRLQRVQTDLFSAQGEIASGMMVEFQISPELVGLVVGKKGARIKQVENDTKVTSINVDGETGRVRVVGPDAASAQRAREMLELVEDSFPLESYQAAWLGNRLNIAFLNDIKAVSDLIVARINQNDDRLDVVGTVGAVRSAKFMLPTQLEYVNRQIEVESSERNAREQLNSMRRQYGLNRQGQGNLRQRGSNNAQTDSLLKAGGPNGGADKGGNKGKAITNREEPTGGTGRKTVAQPMLKIISDTLHEQKSKNEASQGVDRKQNESKKSKPDNIGDAKTSGTRQGETSGSKKANANGTKKGGTKDGGVETTNSGARDGSGGDKSEDAGVPSSGRSRRKKGGTVKAKADTIDDLTNQMMDLKVSTKEEKNEKGESAEPSSLPTDGEGTKKRKKKSGGKAKPTIIEYDKAGNMKALETSLPPPAPQVVSKGGTADATKAPPISNDSSGVTGRDRKGGAKSEAATSIVGKTLKDAMKANAAK